MTFSQQAELVRALAQATPYDGDPGGRGVCLETHISYVLLTGRFAYKIKKALRLDFLDFVSLDARRHFCEEEVRLNRRLAPDIYLGVVPITGTIADPVIGGPGEALDYAVKMRQFPQEGLFSHLIAHGTLTGAHVDALASRVATFHESIAAAPRDGAFGTPEDFERLAIDNFLEMRPSMHDQVDRDTLESLHQWTAREAAHARPALARRLDEGFVRECHGDLHLGNVALVDDAVTIFDGIEFSDRMRWIDVMNEVAFMVMDLEDHGRSDLAFRFLNRYLEATGDYDGLSLLRLYRSYRAMVRAKVTALRLPQVQAPDAPGRGAGARETAERLTGEIRAYFRLARGYTEPGHAGLVITHGVSGSGKTMCSQVLLEALQAIRLRTDVERKRRQHLDAGARSRSGIDQGLYAEDETRQLYAALLETASQILRAGYTTIVDGAFLKRWQRDLFRGLAAELDARFVIVSADAALPTLRERVSRRWSEARDASEADLAVLEHQLSAREPIADDERGSVVDCDTTTPSWKETLAREVTLRLPPTRSPGGEARPTAGGRRWPAT
jgi:aminoglycoside phosphotransferase family enzyme/predicted kinase